MNGVKGVSLIYHKDDGEGAKYAGKYVAGIFSDNNYHYRPEEKSGWGIKFDLYLAPLIRPVPKMWKKEFIKDDPKIKDVYHEHDWPSDLKARQEEKRAGDDPQDVNDFKYGIYNPWKGHYWFVLRIPVFLFFFIAISTPWKSIYLGFKTSKIEPFLDKPNNTDQGDYSWCGENERRLAEKAGGRMFRSAVPSGSIRSDRY